MSGNLGVKIEIAQKQKPQYGEECNHCGWCCMTELCDVAKEHLVNDDAIPCKFLIPAADQYFCGLVINGTTDHGSIGANTGCCAMTQDEVFEQLAQGNADIVKDLTIKILPEGSDDCS